MSEVEVVDVDVEQATADEGAEKATVSQQAAELAKGTPEWLAALPVHYEAKDEKGETILRQLRGDKNLAKYKSLEDAAKGFLEAQRRISQGVDKIPGSDATPEEQRAFWTKIGVPETVDGYADVTVPEADGFSVDEDLFAAVKKAALKNGITPSQLQEFTNIYAELTIGARERLVNQFREAHGELHDEWGFSYPMNMKAAQRFFMNTSPIGGSEVAELLKASGLDEHPSMIRYFYNLSKKMGEDSHGAGIGGEVLGRMDQKAAKDKIDSIRRDKAHPAMDPRNRDHTKALEDLHKLYKVAYPEK